MSSCLREQEQQQQQRQLVVDGLCNGVGSCVYGVPGVGFNRTACCSLGLRCGFQQLGFCAAARTVSMYVQGVSSAVHGWLLCLVCCCHRLLLERE
jgi:hypothetical protein